MYTTTQTNKLLWKKKIYRYKSVRIGMLINYIQ